MNGVSVLMFAFATLVLITGILIYKGHNNEKLLWKAYKKNMSKLELKLIGKTTIIIGAIMLAIAIVGAIFEY